MKIIILNTDKHLKFSKTEMPRRQEVVSWLKTVQTVVPRLRIGTKGDMQAVIIIDELQLTSQPKQCLLFNPDFLTVLHETYSSPNYKKQFENFCLIADI